MWGGRFAEGPGAIMREINASIPFDKALWQQDIAASKAHVAILRRFAPSTATVRVSAAVPPSQDGLP